MIKHQNFDFYRYNREDLLVLLNKHEIGNLTVAILAKFGYNITKTEDLYTTKDLIDIPERLIILIIIKVKYTIKEIGFIKSYHQYIKSDSFFYNMSVCREEYECLKLFSYSEDNCPGLLDDIDARELEYLLRYILIKLKNFNITLDNKIKFLTLCQNIHDAQITLMFVEFYSKMKLSKHLPKEDRNINYIFTRIEKLIDILPKNQDFFIGNNYSDMLITGFVDDYKKITNSHLNKYISFIPRIFDKVHFNYMNYKRFVLFLYNLFPDNDIESKIDFIQENCLYYVYKKGYFDIPVEMQNTNFVIFFDIINKYKDLLTFDFIDIVIRILEDYFTEYHILSKLSYQLFPILKKLIHRQNIDDEDDDEDYYMFIYQNLHFIISKNIEVVDQNKVSLRMANFFLNDRKLNTNIPLFREMYTHYINNDDYIDNVNPQFDQKLLTMMKNGENVHVEQLEKLSRKGINLLYSYAELSKKDIKKIFNNFWRYVLNNVNRDKLLRVLGVDKFKQIKHYDDNDYEYLLSTNIIIDSKEYDSKEFIARFWHFANTFKEINCDEDESLHCKEIYGRQRELLRYSCIKGLLNSLQVNDDNGNIHVVCNPGKVQRLVTSVLQGRIKDDEDNILDITNIYDDDENASDVFEIVKDYGAIANYLKPFINYMSQIIPKTAEEFFIELYKYLLLLYNGEIPNFGRINLDTGTTIYYLTMLVSLTLYRKEDGKIEEINAFDISPNVSIVAGFDFPDMFNTNLYYEKYHKLEIEQMQASIPEYEIYLKEREERIEMYKLTIVKIELIKQKRLNQKS